MPDPAELQPRVRGRHGTLVIGEQEHWRAQIERLHTAISSAGPGCRLLIEPGLAHEFPRATRWRQLLAEALAR